MKKKKPTSGGGRLTAAGKVPVLIGLRPDQAEKLRRAAALDNRPLTQFLVHHGLVAAEKFLEKSGKSI